MGVGSVFKMECLSVRQLLEGFLLVFGFIHDYYRSSFTGWQVGAVGVIFEGGDGSFSLNYRWVAGVIVM